MILYLKAFHIVFVVSWFAGLFYIVRLFIYHREALDKDDPDRTILHNQFTIMERRLMNIIMWPAMVITLITGSIMLYKNPFLFQDWMYAKLGFVALLIFYHVFCAGIMKKLASGKKVWTSHNLRLWNELATIFLVAIVLLVIVRNLLDAATGFGIIVGLIVLLMIGIMAYKKSRKQ